MGDLEKFYELKHQEEMKSFFIKFFIFQTIFYALIYSISFIDNSLTHDGKIFYKPMTVIFYAISITFTFILPMYKIIINERLNKAK